MKYKKYLLILLIAVFLGCNKTYAAEKVCNYIGDGFKARLTITYDGNKASNDVAVHNYGDKYINNAEGILNWNLKKKVYGYEFEKYKPIFVETQKCPEYLVFESGKILWKNYMVWATNDATIAKNASTAINELGNKNSVSYYATYKNADGTAITDEQYFSSFVSTELGGDTLTEDEMTCENLFGDKNDENSLAYLINYILQYVRIIVPILIILLGSLDLAKAVIASKDDEIKKAQTAFIKRLIIGVAVFFVPVLVNIVMQLADIVWEGLGYTTCGL